MTDAFHQPKGHFFLEDVNIHKEKDNGAKQNDDKWQRQRQETSEVRVAACFPVSLRYDSRLVEGIISVFIRIHTADRQRLTKQTQLTNEQWLKYEARKDPKL